MQLQVEATAGFPEISDTPSTQSTPAVDSHTAVNNSGQTISKRLVQHPVAAGTNIESLQSGIMSSTSHKTEETPDDA